MTTIAREPQEGLRRHKLLPKELAVAIPPLYAQDGKGMDAVVYLKLFNAYGRGTWYITEGSAQLLDEDEPISLREASTVDPTRIQDITFFGYCESPLGPDCDELGYATFKELASTQIRIAGIAIPAIERDCHYSGIGKTVRECLETR